MVRNSTEEDDTYQIWSSGLDDEEMRHLTHGVMFVKHYGDSSKKKSEWEEIVEESGEESEDEEKEFIEGKCFVSTTLKSPMTENVRALFISSNIPLNSYNVVYLILMINVIT